ncbi:hypothetical protein NEMBOFW57_000305 [Staphylotrichum longicolle]|uniref:Uncharacterized protein n=1 Tax=Staphylotrichum longicolle TaxID=669026 RepID=A0AAD4EZ50_9PEZI|nr:hypothetical protein NEMBOFW57_000305 [Staphylotrichum longicolle]
MTPNEKDLQLLRQIWPKLSEQELSVDAADYVVVQEYLSAKGKALNAPSSALSPLSLNDVLGVIDEIRRLRASTRFEIVQAVGQKLQHKSLANSVVSKTVDLAASLWLAVNVRSTAELLHANFPVLGWAEDQSLETVLQSAFQPPKEEPLKKAAATVKIKGDLTMTNLVTNFGFSIRWTHNLLEHLSIDWVGRVITVYEHKICLWNHLRFKEDSALPAAILAEAIDTLNLLFPFGDTATEALLRKHGRPFYGLGYFGRKRALDLDDYSYWRKRIEELQQVLEGPPSGLQQLALDRNRSNVLAFTTFWIATAVGVLAVMGLAAGVVSTVYAKKQYDLALLQYALSLAQACAAPGAAEQLPGFCS